jgi:hypothetical protein
MVNAVDIAKKVLEGTYDGVATVIEHQKVRDEGTKLTGYEDVTVLEGQPCRLSFSSIKTAVQSESAASISQTIKLFLSPDVTIKPGSKITVTQSGVTNDYTCSGVPAVYRTHQEIMLDLFEGWA